MEQGLSHWAPNDVSEVSELKTYRSKYNVISVRYM